MAVSAASFAATSCRALRLRATPAPTGYREASMPTAAGPGKPGLFHFVMIKPTHYDDDGYPIQWLRSAIPSNTLACLNGLAEDARARQVLGEGVDIRLHTYDETNRRVRPDKIIRTVRQEGGRVL